MVIEQQVRQFVAQNLLFSENGYPFDDDASFLQEGIIDSLGVMELIAFAEKTFRIKVDPNEVVPDHFDSISRLAGYIRRKTTPLVPEVPASA
jgi:acyl carrier protein